eukprot:GEMP01044986.1.p1 GENE.GEMP01044986.1~~GEMP01044986.1.p1  ORF type:complete len:441 (+),score=101.96 GEMP01044986.1:174-1496(+)
MGDVVSTLWVDKVCAEKERIALPQNERLDCFKNNARYISRLSGQPHELAEFFHGDNTCALMAACHQWSTWMRKHKPNFGNSSTSGIAGKCCTERFGTFVDAAIVIDSIKRFAMEAINRGVPKVLESVDSHLCRGIIANAFLGNLKDLTAEKKHAQNAGGLDFSVLFRTHIDTAAQKILCLLHYFSTPLTEEDVVFTVHCDTRSLQEFEEFLHSSEQPVRPLVLTDESMEDRTCGTLVNFGNPNFGYGHVIGSCTQEEILQVCCPELNVGLLYYGLIPADGIITCRCRYFSLYKGYGATFEFVKPLKKTYAQVLLTMDAVYANHFTKDSVLRDIRKATIGFQNSPGPISTGKWGCGVFGGNVEHKFLQQVIAASIAEKDLRFSTFRNVEEKARLQRLLDTLVAAKCTVGALYRMLPDTAPADGDWYSLLERGVSQGRTTTA